MTCRYTRIPPRMDRPSRPPRLTPTVVLSSGRSRLPQVALEPLSLPTPPAEPFLGRCWAIARSFLSPGWSARG